MPDISGTTAAGTGIDTARATICPALDDEGEFWQTPRRRLNCGFQRFQVEPLEGNPRRSVIRHAQTGQPCANAVTQPVGEDYCLSACVPPERALRSVVTVPVTLADMEPWMAQPKPVRWL